MPNLHRSHPHYKTDELSCEFEIVVLYGGGKLVDIGVRLTVS